jgi:hypothetical protein
MITVVDGQDQHEVALALAASGIYVFPVDHPDLPVCAGLRTPEHDPKTCDQRGKHPVVKFTVAADTNPKMIHTWWAGNPRNIGINCGKSGLIVIDEDKLGELKRYADAHGVKIPRTLVVRTAKGRHYYFLARAGVQIGNKKGAFKGYSIDVRSHNGYVVAPGSTHETGVTYTIEVAEPPAPIPDWIVEALTRSNGSTATGEWKRSPATSRVGSQLSPR